MLSFPLSSCNDDDAANNDGDDDDSDDGDGDDDDDDNDGGNDKYVEGLLSNVAQKWPIEVTTRRPVATPIAFANKIRQKTSLRFGSHDVLVSSSVNSTPTPRPRAACAASHLALRV